MHSIPARYIKDIVCEGAIYMLKKSIYLTITLSILLAAVFSFSVSNAYAQQGGPNQPGNQPNPQRTNEPKGTPEAKEPKEPKETKEPKDNNGKGNPNLQDRFAKVLNGQKMQLEKANKVAEKTQEWITEMKAAGKNTAEVEKALTTFKAELAKMQASYDASQKALEGIKFDATGQPSDRATWAKALSAIMRTNGDFISSLEKAIRDLQKAVRSTTQANKSTPAAKPTAKP
jgi:hypothetical protein